MNHARLFCTVILLTLTFNSYALARDDGAIAQIEAVCEEDTSACLTAFESLISMGTLDQDRDGVSDVADRCPNTYPRRALALLREQERALTEAFDLNIHLHELLLQGANGTFDREGRELLANEVAISFYELLDIANSNHSGRYLFAVHLAGEPPFEATCAFGEATAPTVIYLGHHFSNDFITSRGDLVFFGALDGDGSFPDEGAEDVFALFTNAYLALATNDQSRIAGLLDISDGVRAHLSKLREQTAIQSHEVLERASPPVDARGCSAQQFCARIRVESAKDAKRCRRSDFKNNEPRRRNPKDCRVVHRARLDGRRCTAR